MKSIGFSFFGRFRCKILRHTKFKYFQCCDLRFSTYACTEEKIEIYNTIFTATDIQISIGIFFHISLFRISSQKQLKITKHPQQKLLHMSVKLSFEINTWGFGAAIFRERPLSVLFHSSSLTSTFNPRARSAWGPTLIFSD